jgi:hypothetical protein
VADIGTPATRLHELQDGGCTPQQAWTLFDALPGVRVEEITTGRWRGSELDTGHPWAGALVESGWYGKQFDGADRVQPLLFAGADGRIFSVDPRRVPLALAGRVPLSAMRFARSLLPVLRPALRTRMPRARLRDLEYRGTLSAAMVYDHLPIIDIFRLVDDQTLLGVMDLRGTREPLFFILRRDHG